MNKDELNKALIEENQQLKDELITHLNDKERLVLMAEGLLKEKEYIEKRYKNLKNSKLGRLTIWMWRKKSIAKK